MNPIFHTRLVRQTIPSGRASTPAPSDLPKGRVRKALVVFGLAIFSYFIGSVPWQTPLPPTRSS